MRKLLAADFAQLLRDKVFWAAFAFMIVSTAILVVSTHNMIALDNYAPGTWTAETSMFCMLPSVGIVNAIWLHLFIGSDYDQGTIRNKFICGHTRRAIFFSHWLIASAGALIILAASLVLGTVLSAHYFQTFALDVSNLCWLFLSCAMLTVAYAAINVALAMNISHKASSVVCGMIVMLVLSIAASIIDSIITDITVYGKAVSPLTEKLVFFFYDFLPSGQCVQVNNMMFERADLWPLYSLILIILVTAAGFLLFKRKDIK